MHISKSQLIKNFQLEAFENIDWRLQYVYRRIIGIRKVNILKFSAMLSVIAAAAISGHADASDGHQRNTVAQVKPVKSVTNADYRKITYYEPHTDFVLFRRANDSTDYFVRLNDHDNALVRSHKLIMADAIKVAYLTGKKINFLYEVTNKEALQIMFPERK